MYTYIYIHVYIYTHVDIYICIHTYIHIYVHSHYKTITNTALEENSCQHGHFNGSMYTYI